MVYAILGILSGFLAAFLSTKHVIKKQGAGQLKVCNGCPYRTKPKPVKAKPEPGDGAEDDLCNEDW